MMASHKFDPETGKARIFFRFAGCQYNRMVLAKTSRDAERLCALIEETIQDLDRGKLAMPPGADLITFMLSCGKNAGIVEPATAPPKTVSLGDLFDRYRTDPPPHLEASTRRMQEIHFRRLLEVYPSMDLRAFDLMAAQGYVSRRSKMLFRGRPIQRETIEKELKTLRQAWAWVAGRSKGLPSPSFTLKELSLPKAQAKLPFMSWSQIEREVARGGLTEAETAALWDCLWLDRPQVHELLAHVQETASLPCLHPMFCCAAFTGARRSELCRSRVGDWQFEDQVIKIRQKKRDKDKAFTFRDVALSPKLAEVMREWFARHPGGQFAFCDLDGEELNWSAATRHFGRALAGSKWSVVRGWHVLRHSFASNLASAGVDQRKIDRWMGHSTEIRWRYQHLLPQDQQDAISVL